MKFSAISMGMPLASPNLKQLLRIMKLNSYKSQRGQSLVEYAIIASIVIVGMVVASNGISLLMKDQVQSTEKGLSSGRHLKGSR